uniref:MADS-box domain-containing protein n=1 Tax=Aegilops tauschii subsp. strangulata TaxID=200361 RepID=A0A453G9T0_AEGTS
ALGGKGKGRGGAPARPIAAIPVADGGNRRMAFEVRKAGLMRKAKELAEMADAPVAVLCSGLDGQGALQCWPSTETARAVVAQFLALPKEARIVFDHVNYVAGVRDVQRSRLARVRAGGLAAALGPWESPLDGMSEDALRELLASVDKSLDATRSRIRRLQTQRRESVAENFVVAGEGHASGEVQGTQRQPRGAATAPGAARKKQLVEKPAAADGAARRKQLLKDPKEKPAAADGAARWKQLLKDHKEKPAAAANVDAARRKQLLEGPKEKPVRAAPFDPGMIEHYINVGWYVMERDAYDFIRYDLGMLPPSLEPEPPEPDYDQPLRLWSWDDSSFPQSAPPPNRAAYVLAAQNGWCDD